MLLRSYVSECLILVLFFCWKVQLQVVLPLDISESKPVTLYCNVTDSENTSVSWEYVNPLNEVITLPQSETTLNLTNITQVGSYKCSTNDSTLMTINVSYLARPTILNGRLVTFIIGSMNRTLTCSCVGCFPNVTFTWSREIERSSEEFELVTSEHNSFETRILHHEGTLNSSSVLHFLEVKSRFHTNYKCEVKNAAGTRSAQIQVLVRSFYAFVWPLIGIALELLVIAIIMIVIEVQKRRCFTTKQVSPPAIASPESVSPLSDIIAFGSKQSL